MFVSDNTSLWSHRIQEATPPSAVHSSDPQKEEQEKRPGGRANSHDSAPGCQTKRQDNLPEVACPVWEAGLSGACGNVVAG